MRRFLLVPLVFACMISSASATIRPTDMAFVRCRAVMDKSFGLFMPSDIQGATDRDILANLAKDPRDTAKLAYRIHNSRAAFDRDQMMWTHTGALDDQQLSAAGKAEGDAVTKLLMDANSSGSAKTMDAAIADVLNRIVTCWKQFPQFSGA